MPITLGMKGTSYFCSHITGGVENAITLHVEYLSQLIVSLKNSNPPCTYSTPGTNFQWMVSAIVLPFFH
jgi:hypothetical protein